MAKKNQFIWKNSLSISGGFETLIKVPEEILWITNICISGGKGKTAQITVYDKSSFKTAYFGISGVFEFAFNQKKFLCSNKIAVTFSTLVIEVLSAVLELQNMKPENPYYRFTCKVCKRHNLVHTNRTSRERDILQITKDTNGAFCAMYPEAGISTEFFFSCKHCGEVVSHKSLESIYEMGQLTKD
jgi:hypothetical protein